MRGCASQHANMEEKADHIIIIIIPIAYQKKYEMVEKTFDSHLVKYTNVIFE